MKKELVFVLAAFFSLFTLASCGSEPKATIPTGERVPVNASVQGTTGPGSVAAESSKEDTDAVL